MGGATSHALLTPMTPTTLWPVPATHQDSLSMAAAAGGETVKSPGQLTLTLYASCPDITLTVTPGTHGTVFCCIRSWRAFDAATHSVLSSGTQHLTCPSLASYDPSLSPPCPLPLPHTLPRPPLG